MSNDHQRLSLPRRLYVCVFQLFGALTAYTILLLVFPYEYVANTLINGWLVDHRIPASVDIERLHLLEGFEIRNLYIGSLPGYSTHPTSIHYIVVKYNPVSFILDDKIWIDQIGVHRLYTGYEQLENGQDNIGAWLELIIAAINGTDASSRSATIVIDEKANIAQVKPASHNGNKASADRIRQALKEAVIEMGKQPLAIRRIDITDVSAFIHMPEIEAQAKDLDFEGFNIATFSGRSEGKGHLRLQTASIKTSEAAARLDELDILIHHFRTNGDDANGGLELSLQNAQALFDGGIVRMNQLKSNVSGMVTPTGKTEFDSSLVISRIDANAGEDRYQVNGFYLTVIGMHGAKENLEVNLALERKGDFELSGKTGEDTFHFELPLRMVVTSSDWNQYTISLKAPIKQTKGSGIFNKMNDEKLQVQGKGGLNLSAGKLSMKPLLIALNDKEISSGLFRATDLNGDPKMLLRLEKLQVMNLGPFAPLAMMAVPALRISQQIEMTKDNFTLQISP